MRLCLSSVFVVLAYGFAYAQPSNNPGSIGEPAVLPNPMDPNGDGWITSTGVDFTGPLDESEFELPYLPIPAYQMEPVPDNQVPSTSCVKYELVGDAINGAESTYYYWQDPDGIPDNGDERIFFRFRVARIQNNTVGLSILIDTDNRFGFTGPGADPNAVAGNPGFELEISVTTSSGSLIRVYNVDGVSSPTVVLASYSTDTNMQVAYALNQDPDCSMRVPGFIDIYLPFSALGISSTTQIRMVGASSELTGSVLGGRASDIGGVDGLAIPSDDDQFLAAIGSYPPFTFGNVSNGAPSAVDGTQALGENSPNGTAVHTVSVSDPDGDVLSYTITAGNTGTAFAINSSGQITVNNAAALDFETTPSFILAVTVSDGTLSDIATITINLNNVNEAPAATDATLSLNENSPNGTTVHTVSASDPDGDVLSYSITGGNTGTAFGINGSGQITVNNAAALDFEATPSFSLTVTVSDGTLSDNAFITINLSDVNEAPTAADVTLSLNENAPNGTAVHTVSVSDPDGDALSFTITGGNAGTAFSINSSGQITANNAAALDFETTVAFTLTVTVSDGTLSDVATITINLNDVNEGPTAADATLSLNENSPNGTAVHTVTASDPDGDVLSYTITAGNTGTAFAINSSGQITVSNAAALDFETTPSFILAVTVFDGTLSDIATITINLNDVNEAPTAADFTLPLNENSPNGTAVHTVSVSDPDGDVVSYTITAGNTGTAFGISSSGQITVNNTSALNFEATPTFTLTVTASDGTLSDVATITINLNDVNEAPTAADATLSLNENSPNGTAVHTVSASDPDGDVLSYSITGGNTGTAFVINSSGQINVNTAAALDFEVTPVFILAVTVSDGTLSDIATITINLNDVNEAPAAADATLSLNENSPNGTAVHAVSASDPDGDVLSYSITGGNTNTAFVINSSGQINVNTAAALDFETTPSFILAVTVFDGTLSDIATITINLNDVNEAPTAADVTLSLNENAPNGTAVHTVSASDPDGDVLSYSITGGNTNTAFVINSSGQITVNNAAALDFETTPSFILAVTVFDGTLSDIATITINLNDVNEAPTAADATLSLNENSPNGTAVHTVTASDPDGDALSYVITGGNTGTAFAINSSGQITVNNTSALNFEATPTFTLTVTASDGTLSDVATITINLNDVNEAPTAADATLSLNENSPNGTAVHTVTASDPDGDALSYVITGGNTGTAFAINSSGQITVNNTSALNFEATPTFTLTVTVSDGTLSDVATITINLNDINEAPAAADFTLSLNENSPNGTAVHAVSVSDPDGDVLSYTITAGNTGTPFGISSSGQITVNNAAALDFETTPSFILAVTVSDGTLSDIATITINLNNVNEAPAATDATLSLNENSPNGTTVHTVSASDPDGDVLSYSITGGNTGTAFGINSSGQITVSNAAALDFETVPTFTLTVTVSDGTLSDAAIITINLIDVNESPVNQAPVISDVTLSIDENSPNGTIVHTVSAFDPNGDVLSYTITGTTFAINSSGQITVSDAAALDFETVPTFTLTVTVSDGTLSDAAIITINLIDVNESPVNQAPVISDVTLSIDENSPNGTIVHTVSAFDPNGDVLSYTITGTTFAINSSGQITVSDAAALDFETTPAFILTVTVLDATLSDIALITINLIDVNETPVNQAPVISDVTLSIDENSPNGTIVHTVSAFDPNGDVLSYTITGTTFAINSSGQITVSDAAALDFETTPAFILTVTVLDATLSDIALITINLIDVNETPVNQPPLISDATLSIDENSPNGTVVHTVSASDPNGDVLSYTITGTAFAINSAGQITVSNAAALDFETTPTFMLTVTVSDGTLSDAAIITINLNEVNETLINQPPAVTDATLSIDENSPNGTVVHTVSASDPEGDLLSYKITGGNTGTAFAINSSGQITVSDAAALDFETTPAFILTVTVSDGTLTDDALITINLNDISEVPVDIIDPLKGFSPNGDGENDFWLIKGIDAFPDNEVKVFNRWGHLVFETRRYDNNSNSWRGAGFEGAPETTYFFLISVKGLEPITGYVIMKQ